MQFATTVFLCQLSNVFTFRGGKRRLKRESSIFSGLHFLTFCRHFFFVNFCLQSSKVISLKFVYIPSHIFSFIKSRLLEIRSHGPSSVGPGKDGLTSTSGSQQLDHGRSSISCTGLDQTLGVPSPDTLIVESPWAYLGSSI